jgi:hypothetical protein
VTENSIDNNFVVYGFYREDWTPYYIGKGRPSRPYKKGGRPCSTPPEEKILILYSGLNEQTAYDWEKKLIKRYGRKGIEDGGILLNRSEGGKGVRGIHFPLETRKKMSEKAKSRTGRDHPGTKIHDWTHKEYGDYLSLSVNELIKLFPDQKLKYYSLHNVISGVQISSKGWKLLKNKHIPVKYNPQNKRLCTWEHPVYGVYKNKSVPDMLKIFPELNRSNLQSLISGKRNHHKGWKVLNINCNNFTFTVGGKKSDWTHEKHGLILNSTISELRSKFKNEKLSDSALSLVRSGKISQHKGWKILTKSE